MKKPEYIERYGEEAYKRRLETKRVKRSKAGYIKLHGEEAYVEMAKKRSEGRPKRNKTKYIERYGQEAYEKLLEQARIRNKKQSFIALYGEEAWQRGIERARAWQKAHPEECKVRNKIANREKCRKGGKHYEKHLKDNQTGLQGARNKIRNKHAAQYRPYKKIIALDSQLHHQWIPHSSDYTGVALVETKAHQYGIIDVIQILDGAITLLTEEEVRNGQKNEDEKKN